MAFASKKKAEKKADNIPDVHTGNQDFDNGRLNTKGFNDKAEKPVRGEFWTGVGDFVDGVGSVVLSPNFGMILGYGGAGLCLAASVTGYQALFPSLGLINAGLALAVQYVQILPRMAEYFPEHADRLTLKLGLTRYLDPKVTNESPTLLEEVKDWAKNAEKKQLKLVVNVSTLLYVVEFLGQAKAFKVIDPKTMQLMPEAIFLLLAGTIGFECCLFFTKWMKSQRLTGRQSRKYKELKRKKLIEAEQQFK